MVNENFEILRKLKRELYLRGFTNKTIKAYLFHNEKFFSWINKPYKCISQEDIKDYIIHLRKKGFAHASINLALASIKYLFTRVLKRRFYDLKSLKKQEKHTGVVNHETILEVIRSESNLKHKFLLITFYSTGARVGEVVKIKLEDIDLVEREIIIRQGKGQRDRIVMISDIFIEFFNKYIGKYQPKKFLFEGRNSNYTIESAQNVINKMFMNYNNKHVYPHMIRASFATNLMEKGEDTKKIQVHTGHKSLKSLSPYLHHANRRKNKIVNPLDYDF